MVQKLIAIFIVIFCESFFSFAGEGGAQIHSELRGDSILSCGIEYIDVGVMNGDEFDVHLTLLKDNFDRSYGNTTSKIREVYSYNLPYKKKTKNIRSIDGELEEVEVPTHPPLIISSKQKNTEVIASIINELAIDNAHYFNIWGLPVFGVTQFMKKSFKKNKYFRDRSSYFLKLARNNTESKLLSYVTKGEVDSILGLAGSYSSSGLIVTERYYKLVSEYEKSIANIYRTGNYNKLLNVLNREGLIAKPLNKDFIVVYYDPSKEYARKIDVLHSDLGKEYLDKVQEYKSGSLVPLGVYSIGADAERLLSVDFTTHLKIKKRKEFQFFTGLAKDIGGLFLPFPLTTLLTVSEGVGKVVFNAQGKHIFSSVISSEAHLAALLDSGLAKIDSKLSSKIRGDLESNHSELDFGESYKESELKENRRENKSRMAGYISTQRENICNRIKGIREREFRKTYLKFGERVYRRFTSLWEKFSSNKEGLNLYERNRLSTIRKRSDLVDSRLLLKDFDPFKRNYPEELVVKSIFELSLSKEKKDAVVIRKFLNYSISEKVELASILAVQLNKRPMFYKALIDKVENYTLFRNIYSSNEVYRESLKALISLKLNKKKKLNKIVDIIQNTISVENDSSSLSDLERFLTVIKNKKDSKETNND